MKDILASVFQIDQFHLISLASRDPPKIDPLIFILYQYDNIKIVFLTLRINCYSEAFFEIADWPNALIEEHSKLYLINGCTRFASN